MKVKFFIYSLLFPAVFYLLLLHCVNAESNIIDFDEYPLGALSTGSDSPWYDFTSGGTALTIVSLDGRNALDVNSTSGTGSVVLNTSHESLNSIYLSSAAKVQTGFEFQIPEAAATQTAYLRFNTGSASVGRYFAGMALINGKFAYMTDADKTTTNDNFTSPSDISLEAGIWYRVAFLVALTDGNDITYHINLTKSSDPDSPIFSTDVAFSPSALTNDPLRFTLSPTSSTHLYLRDVEIASIPEASSIVLFGIGMAILAMACFRGKAASD